jgi:hypothetical protein
MGLALLALLECLICLRRVIDLSAKGIALLGSLECSLCLRRVIDLLGLQEQLRLDD